MTLIDIRGVHKRYDGYHALRGVDLAVEEGELFGLIGHNGAGKTTLFKMMLGLLSASAGEIRIDGEAVNGATFRQVRRRIGYLPESLALYDNLSGLETLHFFARLKGADPKTAPDLLKLVGLTDAASLRVRGYSKGMRQRLGFAQALLGAPRLLFLDEPTNGLDPEGIREFYDILDGLRSEGVTVVLTSHILAEIQQRVDRLALLRNGAVEALGTVQSLRAARDLPLTVVVHCKTGTTRRIDDMLFELGLIDAQWHGDEARIACPREGKMALLAALASLSDAVVDVEVREPSLEEVMLGYGGRRAA